MAEILITVKPDGTADVRAEGWQGPTCATLTEPYRKALGQELAARQTPEFYEQPQSQNLEANQ